ncbi:hypothetical protein [Desulfitobacterium chlororespirans]|uniref:Uncharacterized protein n=1 Tax=Desulfitobacterium chlororespirans DSM 11544 TaxID=1121395 RepID=A0A1M7UQM1_9FIRM|nr:hypothetical protein [Desulfitobacterium chlororespirans]SHN85249.1 hypothetical protein SAMN02745215_04395 [Desulfitobacterium chlororespirans DSM 11544]
MDKDRAKSEGDIDMAIPKEPKNGAQPNSSSEHKRKIAKSLKEVTSQHSKLLKKLAE